MTNTPTPEPTHVMEVAKLARKSQTRFSVQPGPQELRVIAEALGLGFARKVLLKGTISPAGPRDWLLEAHLGATVQQSCVVTLEPVTTRIETDISRRFVADMEGYLSAQENREADDLETGVPMMADDTLEPLGTQIDLMDLLQEALALEVPDYPRADGVSLGEAVYTEPGKAAMTDEAARPFAGLAALKDKLGNPDD